MNRNTIKASRLRRLFICTGIGLLLLGGGYALKSNEGDKLKYISVPRDEMISLPWNEGWSVAISVTPGIPFELRGSDEVLYEVSGDPSYLCVLSEGKLEKMNKEGPNKHAGERFYWNPFFGDSQEQPDDIGTSSIRIVRKQEGYTTGFVLIKIVSSSDNSANSRGVTFKADVVASLEFPKRYGTYQTISDQHLKELEATYLD